MVSDPEGTFDSINRLNNASNTLLIAAGSGEYTYHSHILSLHNDVFLATLHPLAWVNHGSCTFLSMLCDIRISMVTNIITESYYVRIWLQSGV